MSDIEKKIAHLKEIFAGLTTNEEKVCYLLELGRSLQPLPAEGRIAANQVSGCQSILFLSSYMSDGKLFFDAHADALLSAGLAALLIAVYSGETPQTILQTPPAFLSDLGIFGSLTLSRSNGLAHIHQRMKKDALKFLLSMDFNSPLR